MNNASDANLHDHFYEKSKIGEKDLEICEFIRSDSVGEFFTYMKKDEISFDFKFEKSIKMTN